MDWELAVLVFLGFVIFMFYCVGVFKVGDWATEKTEREWIGYVIWMCCTAGVLLSVLAGFLW